MWVVAGFGFACLVVLALLVGRALDRQAREDAWHRIATSRRTNFEQRRENEEHAVELDAREAELDLRERRVEYREELLFGREVIMEQLERGYRDGPPELSAS